MPRLFPAAVIFCTLIFPLMLLADTTSHGYQVLPARPGERCTVCGTELTADDIAFIVKGRRVPLSRSMVDEFLSNQEIYFENLQPKGALFQENDPVPGKTGSGGISFGWFLVGLYLLIALLFAGLSGYAAVGKGLEPLRYFFIGLAFNAFGFLYVLTRRSRVSAGEIPDGFAKVPSTRRAVPCAKCGYPNHPSSRKCIGCGSELTPSVDAETSRV